MKPYRYPPRKKRKKKKRRKGNKSKGVVCTYEAGVSGRAGEIERNRGKEKREIET